MSIPRARGGVDQGEALDALPPHVAADRLVVGHLHRKARLLADPDRLPDRVEQSLRFVAHVRDVDAAVCGGDLGQLDDLLGRREAARDVEQAGRQPERTLFHRLGDERPHPIELVRRRLAVVGPDDSATDRPLADVDRPVRADGGLGDARQVRTDRKR